MRGIGLFSGPTATPTPPRTIVVVGDLELEAIFEIIDPTGLDNVGAQKIFRDGLLIIRRDGVEYNAMGQEL